MLLAYHARRKLGYVTVTADVIDNNSPKDIFNEDAQKLPMFEETYISWMKRNTHWSNGLW